MKKLALLTSVAAMIAFSGTAMAAGNSDDKGNQGCTVGADPIIVGTNPGKFKKALQTDDPNFGGLNPKRILESLQDGGDEAKTVGDLIKRYCRDEPS